LMKRSALILAITPLLMGMGGGGPVSDSIPRPKESYRAELVDRQGVRTHVDFLSCDGKTFLPLERGEGTLMVPFSKMRKVTVGAEGGSRVKAKIEVDGSKNLEGSLPRSLLCTGVTDYGNYQIEIRGLQEIDLAQRP
jgi:hypothetical protein